MAVPFSNTKLRPPRGFRNILEGLSREVLRCQPGDIYAFGTLYFDRLLRVRHETGWDPAEIGDLLEDRFYNKIFKSIGVRLTQQDLAAIKIQTKYRQYRAKQYVAGVRAERAAVKIQAGYHGWVARKEVRRMREEQELDAEVARIQADIDDEQRLEAEGDFPAAFAPPSRPHRGDDEEDEMQHAAMTIQTKIRQIQAKNRVHAMRQEKQAAVKIQAGYRGFKARQQVRRMRDSVEDLTTDAAPAETAEDAASPADASFPDLLTGNLEEVEEMQKAATKIQAGFRGFKARKQIKGEHQSATETTDDTEPTAVESGAQLSQSAADDDEQGDEEEEHEDDVHGVDGSEMSLSRDEAAMKIQAGIKGMLARRSIRSETQDTGEEQAEEQPQD